MRTSRIADETNHLPTSHVTVEEMAGDLVLFRLYAQDAARARTTVESLARQHGVHVQKVLDVEPAAS